jgi:hypothetical protein
MKDVELGFLDLPRSLLEKGQVDDQWFPLLPSSSLNSNSGFLVFSDVDEDAINKMSIRVKAEYKVLRLSLFLLHFMHVCVS